MSSQNPGNFITKNNVAPTSSFPTTPAPGVWSMEEVLQYRQAGVWPSAVTNAIEDVFSTYLYTGTGATQTITNGIDLSTYGGLVWTKSRSDVYNHALVDTTRGGSSVLVSNNADPASTSAARLSFSSTGYNVLSTSGTLWNNNASTYASWTFRKQAKFFDVVTYTGNGTAGRTVSHNLGSVPGCIIIKRTDAASEWMVYHRGLTAPAQNRFIYLNATNAESVATNAWNDTAPTSTVFTLGTNLNLNFSGGTYVAYLFAHDAGGFGASGTDNVISCGSFTADGSGNATVNLGYEPQFIICKASSITGNWYINDNMRGYPVSVQGQGLYANTAGAEVQATLTYPTATGFVTNATPAPGTYIYIAIRRGPMRPPTIGTSVFSPDLGNNATSAPFQVYTSGFPVDLSMQKYSKSAVASVEFMDRLRGSTVQLSSASTAAESTTFAGGYTYKLDDNSGVDTPTAQNLTSGIAWMLRRAPGFFDVVCYTGTGAAANVSHNLGVVPELMIVKRRSAGTISWAVYANALGNNGGLELNTNGAAFTGATTYWNSTTPTSSVFTVGTDASVNTSSSTYVAYLFASATGVSKVGSYTGTGALQTINCGFTSGARFVLIKRTDSTGDWYTYDSARGITSGSDPYLLLNSTAAEVTGTNYVDTTSVGFQVTAAAPAELNANGGTYIFLAIA
jgi:hypothetical protein